MPTSPEPPPVNAVQLSATPAQFRRGERRQSESSAVQTSRGETDGSASSSGQGGTERDREPEWGAGSEASAAP
jgi:hypothetical protein